MPENYRERHEALNNMNIHGYKLKKKEIRRMIREEQEKKYPDRIKIRRLEGCIRDCSYRIRLLRQSKEEKKGKK